MKKLNFTKVHGNIGKVLCGAAGAIVGFFVGGALVAFAGLVVGVALGHLLEAAVLNPSLKN